MVTVNLKITLIFFVSLIGLALSGCDKANDVDSATSNPEWSEYVSAHTSGLVSKDAWIRIRFVNDIISNDNIGEDASGSLQLDPAIDGKVTFENKREIVLVPNKPLAPASNYKATLSTKNLAGIPEKLGDFKFSFQIIKQEFEISIEGLTTNPDDDTELNLSGSVVTADKEENSKIEQMLSAEYLGKGAAINWQHAANGKQHDFNIKSIQRQKEAAILNLSWNGKVINVDSEGKREIEVPAEGVFNITQVRAVQADRQYISIEFSDKLKTSQNLRGLIELSKNEFTTRIQDNSIMVYPNSPLKGKVTVIIDGSIKSSKNKKLGIRAERSVFFSSEKPKVRFVGKGVILPDNKVLSIPFETVNVHSVQVTAFRVYSNNIGQFLQANKLSGNSELGRVGRYLWRKTIALDSAEGDKWNRYSLDASELLRKYPSGLFRLTLSINRGNSTFSCSKNENDTGVKKEAPLSNNEDLYVTESSGWDSADQYNSNNNNDWRDRNNPCKDYYYSSNSDASSSRNFMASNIGLIAKRGQSGKIHIVATDLATAKPIEGVSINIMNFQNRKVASLVTNNKGFANTLLNKTPFYLVASKGKQKGYLKLTAGTALPVSHFDVGGQKVKKGIKGFIYGERGVWRPGDNIYLTFVLQDKENLIPDSHPVTMQLFNPKGQLMQSMVNNKPVDNFYTFNLKTKEADLTGNWTVKAILGGSTFTKKLKIETVVPNRLKVELDFGKDVLRKADMPIKADLFGQWLHGATASGLKADVNVTMRSVASRFERFTDYIFDDPARKFRGEKQVLFEGELDDKGHAIFEKEFWPGSESPGVLSASFTSRVFEQGGAFSSSRRSIRYYPYINYVGIKLPKGDQIRGMLLTDIKHTVEIGTLDADSKPVSLSKVQVTLYKINWKWWWDKSGESLANYASASHHSKLQQSIISTVDGRGQWEFEIKYPDWGRYLVRACDLQGKHCTGKVVYIDWPGWAGRAQEQTGVGASTLSFFADKQKYNVGDVAKIQLPKATQGRALLSIENGSSVLQQRWIEFNKENTVVDLPITAEMSPNVYVSVTLIQPHKDKKNDRPIRLYGVIPVTVNDPKTKLAPVLTAADEWVPQSTAKITVAEEKGRAMTYTLAMVDEGLLGLTNYKTPNLRKHFYKKEALGVNTWDLFDDVAGAYGGELERLLALGGGDSEKEKESEDKKRFPPVVKFLGPFKLAAGKKKSHEIKLPEYVGAVRVMIVAGKGHAYGLTDKSVFVRSALTMLPTVPRVLGPEEDVTIPVSIFSMDESIKEVELKIETDNHFEMIGDNPIKIAFAKQGEQLGFIKLRVRPELGKGQIRFTASSGKFKTTAEVNIDVRSANPKTLRQLSKVIKPGEEWSENVIPHGLKNTNEVSIEVSAVPPINLERRLRYLIRYPHGCVEQVTSSVFPQLFLAKLISLDGKQKNDVEKNINAGVDRLRGFQTSTGGFMYWPGNGQLNAWATNYVGHFLLEADKKGYQVPTDMLNNWVSHQKNTARNWIAGTGRSELDQAYRLYTLALAGKAELGAMNRLRESDKLNATTRWQLAAAYSLAGLNDVAGEMFSASSFEVDDYVSAGNTFGSRLRDKAIILNSLVQLGELQQAKQIADDVSASLSADKWHSTQSVAYSLLAMSKFVGDDSVNAAFSFERLIANGAVTDIKSKTPLYSEKLISFPLSGARIKLKNTSERTLYANILVEGMPRAGEEKASSKGLTLSVSYSGVQGNNLNFSRLIQGTDFVAKVTVKNVTQAKLDNIALTQVVPSGWEIHNQRMDGQDTLPEGVDYQDIRDDRVYTYFGLKPGEERTFKTMLNATYLGKYYLPSVSAEAMYDATKQARSKGEWVEVFKQ